MWPNMMVEVVGSPQRCCRTDYRQPLLRIYLVGADHAANIIIEDFHRRTRQRTKLFVTKHPQEPLDRYIQCRRALRHFERRKCMNVHFGYFALHRLYEIEIRLAGIVRVDAARHAPLPRFAHATR